MKNRLPFLGSLILGLVLFYLFFLWQFPYMQLKKAMVQAFEGAFPLTLSIGRLRPSMPASLRAENIRVSSDSLSFQVPDLTLNPSLQNFFLEKTDWAIGDTKSFSRLQGRFQQEKNRNRLDFRLNQVEVQGSSPEEFSFSLKLSGEASLQWEGEDWEKGNGQAWALLEWSEIQGGRASKAPFLLILYDTLRVEVQLKDGIIRMKRLEASGKDTRFSLQKDLQFPLRGGIPSDWRILLSPPQK